MCQASGEEHFLPDVWASSYPRMHMVVWSTTTPKESQHARMPTNSHDFMLTSRERWRTYHTLMDPSVLMSARRIPPALEQEASPKCPREVDVSRPVLIDLFADLDLL